MNKNNFKALGRTCYLLLLVTATVFFLIICAKTIEAQLEEEPLVVTDLCFNTPLPEPIIDKETHTRIVESVDFNGDFQDNPYCHWIASGHTIKGLEERLIEQARIMTVIEGLLDECLNPPVVGPDCDSTQDFKDGPGGSLWKPVSESTGRVLTIMPIRFCNASVTLWHDDIQIDTADLRACGPNGNRVHHDFGRRCGDYPDDLVVRFVVDGMNDCRTVEDSCGRYD